MAALAVVMHRHHRRAVWTICAAVTLDAALGIAFAVVNPGMGAGITRIGNGLWFSEVTATTVGYGDIIPHGWPAHLIAAVMMATVIPLVTATFSLFTSGLTSQDVKDHVDKRLNLRNFFS